jgi:hypothetical protein
MKSVSGQDARCMAIRVTRAVAQRERKKTVGDALRPGW